ncbi:hypothetical protein CH373_15415 [Leptospira perolatii]|uniref:Uncharacterized protein n=1 Tax=Leptospira perolatii TaxID=2023191 RepID=A0A2M9ZK09_9LEPT|nr:hypothetical protein [Leptospira perolatii]PJZ69479.1 hypothetical protein CH360_10755 [Leptospira perolatii]PJZ72304.1 hypothetical protein CH373_15415 [Leptospira perolatii]
MKAKTDGEVLLHFYTHSDFLEETWAEYKNSVTVLKALNLNIWTFASFIIYEDISRQLPNVIKRNKSDSEQPSEFEFEYTLKKADITIQAEPELFYVFSRIFEGKQIQKKVLGKQNHQFWELHKEFLEEDKGRMTLLLEDFAKKVIRFNNELELELIEYYGFNYRKRLNIDSAMR